MNLIKQVDLKGTWRFTPEGGSSAEIAVPGGGWLKQGFDCEAGLYETTIQIPLMPDQQIKPVFKLHIGAVNHEAKYWIGKEIDQLVLIHEEVTAFTPQEVDLTPYVEPGESYILQIAVRAFRDGRPIAPHAANWCECVPRGLFREVYLAVYPAVYISDTFVVTRVSDRTMECHVEITNSTGEEKTVKLDAKLASWNGIDWPYPKLPAEELAIPPRQKAVVHMNQIKWLADEGSFWKPNLPYDEHYKAQLHWFHVSMNAGTIQHDSSVRFGFREIRQDGLYYSLNGVRINFRGDSIQPANYDRIDNGGKGDAIGTLPGFLPPSAENPGWPQAVHHFLRLNMNVQRQHMVPWSPYMLDVCDELGLMVIGESASRLNGFDRIDGRAPYEAKCLQDIVRRDRNHPCIIRWSLVNEPQCTDPEYHLELYNAVKQADWTRPLSEDIWSGGYLPEKVEPVFELLLDKPDFTWIEHYLTYRGDGSIERTSSQLNDAVIPLEDRPFGLGEANWDSNGNARSLANFAATMALVRAQDASDIRPYVLLSSWASSIPGVRADEFIIEGDRFRPLYGEDNLQDPWSNPGIRLYQSAMNPLLAIDREFWHLNRKNNGAGAFPVMLPKISADAEITREIIVFNDDLEGDELELRAELRSGSLSNISFSQARTVVRLQIGFHRKLQLAFIAPPLDSVVLLSLEVWKAGVLRYKDEMTCYEVVNGIVSEWNYAKGEDRSLNSLQWNTPN